MQVLRNGFLAFAWFPKMPVKFGLSRILPIRYSSGHIKTE